MARSDINTVAAQGFEQAVTIYEQARPTYPDEVITLIKSLYNKPDIIVDLGAGTGKLTRLLGPIGAREIVAIEPLPSMRETLKRIPIITKIIDGTAEHIPLDDHTIDIIICAQSFHWFANHRAIIELNRVLKSDGLLMLIWNAPYNDGILWDVKINEYVDSFKPPDLPRYKTMKWKQAFDHETLFSPLQYQQFSHTERMTRELGMKRILSTSFVAALPADQQTKLINEVQQMLENVEELQNVQEFDVRQLTHVYWCSPVKASLTII